MYLPLEEFFVANGDFPAGAEAKPALTAATDDAAADDDAVDGQIPAVKLWQKPRPLYENEGNDRVYHEVNCEVFDIGKNDQDSEIEDTAEIIRQLMK